MSLDDYHNVLTERKTNSKTNSAVTNTYTYDPYGNVTLVELSASGMDNLKTEYTYSNAGNYLHEVKDNDDNKTTYTYDPQTGDLLSIQYPEDSEDPSVSYEYDSLHHVTKMTQIFNDSLQADVSFEYNADNLTKIQTPSTPYTFSYGNFNLPSQIKAGNYVLARYSYNYKNQLATLDYGNGDKVQYTYDKDGNVTKITYEDNKYIGYTYDATGALIKATDSATGRTGSFIYDEKKRLEMQSEIGGVYSHILQYAYNDYDQIISIIESVGNSSLTTNYTYDDEHRVSSVQTGSASQSYTYDSYSRLKNATAKHGNATVKTDEYTFNGDSQISAHVIKRNGTATYGMYGYTYDDNGNIAEISGGGYTITYAYDAAGQLIRENNPQLGRTYIWTYDESGNILRRKEYAYSTVATSSLTGGITINYVYDDENAWGDLLTSYDGQTITYDAIGNTLSDGLRTYTWEHGRRLKNVEVDGDTWTYTYDVNGMRAGRSTSGTAYSYVYNGSQLSYMTVDGNTLRFIYGATGAPLAVIYNGDYYYYVTNIQGDVIGILDSDGFSQVTYAYDAWGNVTVSGPMDDDLGIHNPLRYRGYVYDEETGLYYLQSRYYNPETGRFINTDEVTLMGINGDFVGYNLFAYCGNNPVARADDGGRFWNVVIGAIVGGVVSGAVSFVTQALEKGIENVDLGSVLINVAVGAAGGAIAATGLHMGVQAGLTALVSGGGNFAEQWHTKGINNINYYDVACTAFLGGVTSLAGSVAGKIAGGKLERAGNALLKKGRDKLLTGLLRETAGQSHSTLMKQGAKLAAQGIKTINTYRGVSSVIGSLIGGVTGSGYNALKICVLGW